MEITGNGKKTGEETVLASNYWSNRFRAFVYGFLPSFRHVWWSKMYEYSVWKDFRFITYRRFLNRNDRMISLSIWKIWLAQPKNRDVPRKEKINCGFNLLYLSLRNCIIIIRNEYSNLLEKNISYISRIIVQNLSFLDFSQCKVSKCFIVH